MTYKWTDGAPQEAPAARTTVYHEVLSAIGDGLATPYTVHSKVPRLESEVRARRVLDAMVTAGLLDCSIRPGRALYRKAGPLPPPKPKPPERNLPIVSRDYQLSPFTLAILSCLHQRPWMTVRDVAQKLESDVVSVSRRLSKLFIGERVRRRGIKNRMQYAINHKSREF